MGALTSNNPIDYHVCKKQKVSGHDRSPGKVRCFVSRYPEVKNELKREVHGPVRGKVGYGLDPLTRIPVVSTEIGSGCISRRKEAEINAQDENNDDSMVWTRYEERKSIVYGAIRYLDRMECKGKEKEKEVLEDSSVEEVGFVEDGRERVVVISDDEMIVENAGLLEKEKGLERGRVDERVIVAESAGVRDETKVECRMRRVLSSWFVNIRHLVSDPPAYKKLLGIAARRDPILNSLQAQIKLKEKEKQSLSLLPWLLVKWPQEKEDSSGEPFVPLTSEEEKDIELAFRSDRNKVLASHEGSNIQITGEVLQCLRPGAWLNDEVINLYLALLKERERREPKEFLKCHFFNTFFYKRLIGGRGGYDYKSVRRWTTQKKLGYGLLECDKIFVPIHQEVHWCLAVINRKDQKFQYLDSLGGRDTRVLRVLAKYYVDEVKDKNAEDIDVSSWSYDYVKDLPQQENGSDCGMFMIKYIDFYSRGLSLMFSQEDMPYFRRRTAKEILKLRAD